MNPWFTVEQIDDNSFTISEYRHWEEPHSYLLCGSDAALLIDTGLGVASIRQLTDRLTPLPISVVLTHAHWDHIGGLNQFQDFAVHEAERSWLAEQFPLSVEAVRASLMKEPCAFPADFLPERYCLFRGEPRRLLRDGECLRFGGRELLVLHTPGHSPGHCCFYEPARGYLFTGDMIYQGCLDAFYPSTDPQQFYQSAKRLQGLDVRRILPGHHALEIPISLLADVEAGLARLERAGKLCHGSGRFDFGSVQIHI